MVKLDFLVERGQLADSDAVFPLSLSPSLSLEEKKKRDDELGSRRSYVLFFFNRCLDLLMIGLNYLPANGGCRLFQWLPGLSCYYRIYLLAS